MPVGPWQIQWILHYAWHTWGLRLRWQGCKCWGTLTLAYCFDYSGHIRMISWETFLTDFCLLRRQDLHIQVMSLTCTLPLPLKTLLIHSNGGTNTTLCTRTCHRWLLTIYWFLVHGMLCYVNITDQVIKQQHLLKSNASSAMDAFYSLTFTIVSRSNLFVPSSVSALGVFLATSRMLMFKCLNHWRTLKVTMMWSYQRDGTPLVQPSLL